MPESDAWDERAVIEQHRPLVRHIVFQVAVRFPATSTGRSWPGPAAASMSWAAWWRKRVSPGQLRRAGV